MDALQQIGVSTMRAVVLTQFGSEEHLEYRKDLPVMRPNAILVKVKACGVTENDKKLIQRKFKVQRDLPLIVGRDVVGTVEAIGLDVKCFQVGDEVAGIVPADTDGGLAEYVVCNADYFVKRPASLTHGEAAAVMTAGLRAISILHYKMKFTPGDSILVLNAASPTGTTAIQLALHWGGKVIATANNHNEFNYVQSISPKIDRVIDLSTEKLTSVVMEETAGLGVDLILQPDEDELHTSSMPEAVRRSLKRDCIKCLGLHSTWVCSQPLQLDPPETSVLLGKDASIVFANDQTWIAAPSQQGRFLHMLSEVLEYAAKGVLQVPVVETLPLEKARQALSIIGTIFGRVIVVP